MMRVSKLTDYAIVVLSQMQHGSATPVAVGSLAEQTGVPQPTVAKVLKSLASAGLLHSHRGANGGYSLALPPDRISIGAVISALDGPIALTDCVSDTDETCGVQSLCPLRGNWDRVNRAIRTALDQVSVADMLTPPAPTGSADVGASSDMAQELPTAGYGPIPDKRPRADGLAAAR